MKLDSAALFQVSNISISDNVKHSFTVLTDTKTYLSLLSLILIFTHRMRKGRQLLVYIIVMKTVYAMCNYGGNKGPCTVSLKKGCPAFKIFFIPFLISYPFPSAIAFVKT